MKRIVLSIVLVLVSQLASAALTLPTGFFGQDIGPSGDWDIIVGLTFAPDGRLFVLEKRGRVYIVQDDFRLSTPFLNIDSEVLSNGDRGLLGIALDPDFTSNRWVYLLYTVDPNGDGVDNDLVAYARLTRYRASASNPNVADVSSRQVLIGSTWSTAFPSQYDTHSIGSLRFAPDGSLLISTGEGAHPNGIDAGGRDPTAFGTGKFPLIEDIGSFRSQWLGSLGGKILRIDPETGAGLPSNPYYTGDPLAYPSRVWAYGLRNPYRFALRPGTGSTDQSEGQPGTLYISDVGWATWEEVNVSSEGGENFGWPCREGLLAADQYPDLTPAHHGCDTLGTSDNPTLPKDPLMTWNHNSASVSSPAGLAGKCSSAISFYDGTQYPSKYRGACFFGDFEHNWIKVARVDQNNNLIEVLDFATDAAGPVDLEADPVSKDIYYVSVLRKQIYRIRYDATNNLPVAQVSATPVTGSAPLSVQFSSSGTVDPDGDSLIYRWYFGDGQTSTAQNPTHSYISPGVYSATLTVDDGRGGQGSKVVSISAAGSGGANTPPTATILSPVDNTLYLNRAELFLSATASDAQDSIGNLQFSWEVILHHNTHIHPGWLYLTGQTGSFLPLDHDDGTGTWLEIVLQVRDTGGLSDTRRVFVYPNANPLVLDNGDPGTSSVGSWPKSDAFFYYGADSVYSKAAGNTYSYNFSLPQSGSYKVYAWWSVFKSRPTAAPYTVYHSAGSSTVNMNQLDNATRNVWNYVGTYSFGSTARVTITSVGGNFSTCADAICLLPAGAVASTPVAHIDSIQPRPAVVGASVSFVGHGDDGGSITSYLWRSSIDGTISNQSSFTTSALSVGTHTIFFQVTGSQGSTSPDDTMTLEILPLAPAGDVIVDNGQAGTSAVGTWSSSGAPNPYGTGSVYSKTVGDVYTYQPALQQPGVYDVYAWWTELSSRTTAAPYDITYATGTNRVYVNQRVDGGKWNYLGTFVLGSTPAVTINATSSSTCADAVRFAYRGNTDRIMDNGDPGTSFTGNWVSSSGSSPYGSGSVFVKSTAGSYSYSFTGLTAGPHEIFAWWSAAASRTTQAQYTVFHSTGDSSVTVSQLQNAGKWNSLGTFTLGTSAMIKLNALANGSSYCADAVRLRRVNP